MNRISEKKILTFILIVGFLLRVAICFFSGLPHRHEDTPEYYHQANILLSGGYLNFFPNGYPLLIAFAKFITPAYSDTLLLWCNILLSTLTIWFIYDIGKRVFSNSFIALAAAAILAVFPSQVNYVRWLTSELPSAFLLLGAYFFYYRKQNIRSGIFFALAIFVRTNVTPIAIALLAIKTIREKKIPWRLAAGTVLPLIIVGLYCFWKTGEFSIAGNNQINILYSITASGGYVDFSYNRNHPELNTGDKIVAAYIDHMKNEPGEYLGQKWANYWELWGFYPSSQHGTRNTKARLLIGIGNFFMIVFGAIGWRLHRHSFAVNLLTLPFITVTCIHVILFVLTRYTYPVEPFMILLAASAGEPLTRNRNPSRPAPPGSKNPAP